MVRFVPGLNWTLNPGYLKSLRGVDPRAAAALDASPGVLDALRIEVDGVPLGGGIGEGDPRVTIYIEVDDPQSYLDQVTQAGGKTLMPVTKVTDAVTLALFVDPASNVIGLLKANPG